MGTRGPIWRRVTEQVATATARLLMLAFSPLVGVDRFLQEAAAHHRANILGASWQAEGRAARDRLASQTRISDGLLRQMLDSELRLIERYRRTPFPTLAAAQQGYELLQAARVDLRARMVGAAWNVQPSCPAAATIDLEPHGNA